MTDDAERELATDAVNALGAAIGVPLPAGMIVALGEMLATRLRGLTWGEALAAGVAAHEKVKTEADAERSRRERMGEP